MNIKRGDKVATAIGVFTVTNVAPHGVYAYPGLDKELDELIRYDRIERVFTIWDLRVQPTMTHNLAAAIDDIIRRRLNA